MTEGFTEIEGGFLYYCMECEDYHDTDDDPHEDEE